MTFSSPVEESIKSTNAQITPEFEVVAAKPPQEILNEDSVASVKTETFNKHTLEDESVASSNPFQGFGKLGSNPFLSHVPFFGDLKNSFKASDLQYIVGEPLKAISKLAAVANPFGMLPKFKSNAFEPVIPFKLDKSMSLPLPLTDKRICTCYC